MSLCWALLAICAACTQADQDKARREAAEAREKARKGAERLRADARKLGHEARQEAGDFNHKVNQALHNEAPTETGTATGAQEKLRRGGDELRAAGGKAATSLDRAAIIAKVKARLANQAGLSTITSVEVDAAGQVVTLRGSVSSEQQKQQAEQSARQVAGVTKVIDHLQVKP